MVVLTVHMCGPDGDGGNVTRDGWNFSILWPTSPTELSLAESWMLRMKHRRHRRERISAVPPVLVEGVAPHVSHLQMNKAEKQNKKKGSSFSSSPSIFAESFANIKHTSIFTV